MSSLTGRVLITGCTSLTGAAFASALHNSGFDVVAATTQPAEKYSGLQRSRLRRMPTDLRTVSLGSFGSPAFLSGLKSVGGIDALLFHHAQVGDHRSTSFDIEGSLNASTLALREVLEVCASRGARTVVITRSVFEAGQGGDNSAPPLSGYGLAKTRISQRVRQQAGKVGMGSKDFVIPNPIGFLEKPGLSTYLCESWMRGEIPTLANPHSRRDFIPVELLADEYVQAVFDAISGQSAPISPSLWPMRVVDWATHLAASLGSRIGRKLDVHTDLRSAKFSKPDSRVGRHPIVVRGNWSHEDFWNEYLKYLAGSL